MLVIGSILMIIGGLLSLIIGIAYLVTCWKISPSKTLLTFVPIIGIYFSLNLLICNWQELKGLFFSSIFVTLMYGAGAVMVGAGMGSLDAVAEAEAEAERERERERSYTWNNSAAAEPKPYVQPAPPLDDPIFKPGQLAAGLPDALASVDDWPTFDTPDSGLSEGKTLNLKGYELAVPDGYDVIDARPTPDGQGMQWRIGAKGSGAGQAGELTVRLFSTLEPGETRVFEPTWAEVIGQANISPTKYTIEYGRINAIPFARCTDEQVTRGQGIGQVIYLGKLSPTNPQRLEIEFATEPKGFGPSYALMFEAIVRSIKRGERVVLPPPSDPTSVPSLLANASGTEIQPVASADQQVRGPFAFDLGIRSEATLSRWDHQGQVWQTAMQFSDARDVAIDLTLQPEADIPADRVRPIVQSGPVQADALAYAFGEEARYVRLWNDEVFARIEHAPEQRGTTVHSRVTYHGYLNTFRVEITLTNRADSGITMAELEDYLHRVRLATVPELAESSSHQLDWIKTVLLDPDQPVFHVANGVEASQALVIDERGQIAVSPQYDAENHRMYAVYPTIDDVDILKDYERWKSNDDDASHLGSVERLDDIAIRPIAELSASHRPKQLIWEARTKAGKVGMTLHIEQLKESDYDWVLPVTRHASTGRVQIRLGRRLLQPTETPEVTYRELGNLRVWRVKVPPSPRQEIARCHYLAIVPEKMIVISTSYLADRPEQLDAFDASVATLVYRDGASLSE